MLISGLHIQWVYAPVCIYPQEHTVTHTPHHASPCLRTPGASSLLSQVHLPSRRPQHPCPGLWDLRALGSSARRSFPSPPASPLLPAAPRSVSGVSGVTRACPFLPGRACVRTGLAPRADRVSDRVRVPASAWADRRGRRSAWGPGSSPLPPQFFPTGAILGLRCGRGMATPSLHAST